MYHFIIEFLKKPACCQKVWIALNLVDLVMINVLWCDVISIYIYIINKTMIVYWSSICSYVKNIFFVICFVKSCSIPASSMHDFVACYDYSPIMPGIRH